MSPKNADAQSRLEAFLPTTHSPRKAAAAASGLPDASSEPLVEHPLRVYVLCGVVGSGKSTLAVQLEALYPQHYVRVNQDSLGNRGKCESLTRTALSQGKSPIIDRQNYDASQRYTWLQIGHKVNVEVVALVFQTNTNTCANRLRKRVGHESIKTPEQGLQVLSAISRVFVPPRPDEGFHRIVILPQDLPLRYSMAHANAVIALVDQCPRLQGTLPSPPARPNGDGPWLLGRGRGRGRGREPQSTRDVASQSAMNAWLGSSTTSRPLQEARPAASARGRGYHSRGSASAAAGSWRRQADDATASSRDDAQQPTPAVLSTRKAPPTSRIPATGFIDIPSDSDEETS